MTKNELIQCFAIALGLVPDTDLDRVLLELSIVINKRNILDKPLLDHANEDTAKASALIKAQEEVYERKQRRDAILHDIAQRNKSKFFPIGETKANQELADQIAQVFVQFAQQQGKGNGELLGTDYYASTIKVLHLVEDYLETEQRIDWDLVAKMAPKEDQEQSKLNEAPSLSFTLTIKQDKTFPYQLQCAQERTIFASFSTELDALKGHSLAKECYQMGYELGLAKVANTEEQVPKAQSPWTLDQAIEFAAYDAKNITDPQYAAHAEQFAVCLRELKERQALRTEQPNPEYAWENLDQAITDAIKAEASEHCAHPNYHVRGKQLVTWLQELKQLRLAVENGCCTTCHTPIPTDETLANEWAWCSRNEDAGDWYCPTCNKAREDHEEVKEVSEHTIVIEGKTYDRLRYGTEDHMADKGRPCQGCSVYVGCYHEKGCMNERCPGCGGQLNGDNCDCPHLNSIPEDWSCCSCVRGLTHDPCSCYQLCNAGSKWQEKK